eukprot:COSAG01_NODE_3621_length_5860_cov_4.719840_7_plen_113_part_00
MIASVAPAAATPAAIGTGGGKAMLWLPLGDSITWGCGTDSSPRGDANCTHDAGGYRVPLAWAMSQAGYNVSTMGPLKTGPDTVTVRWLRQVLHYECLDFIIHIMNLNLNDSL